MKKIIVFSVVAFFGVVLLNSCKKSYECHCHKADGTHEHIKIKTTKSKADEECKAKAVGTYTACEIQ